MLVSAHPHTVVADATAARAETSLRFGVARRLLGTLSTALRAVGPALTDHVDVTSPLDQADSTNAAADDSTNGAVDWGQFELIHQWLIDLSERRPIRLLIDDAQWADRESLQLVNYLARRVPGTDTSIVCAIRTEAEPVDEVVELIELADAHHRPGPLQRTAVEQIVATELDVHIPPEVVDALIDRTHSNALLVTEVARALRTQADARPVRDGELASSITVADLDRAGAGAVSSAVSARLRNAAPDAARLARIASSLGPGTDIDIVRVAAALDRDQLHAAHRELVALAVLADDAQRIHFVHALVADAIQRRVAPAERSEHLARAVRACVDTDRPARDAAALLARIDDDGRADAAEQLAGIDSVELFQQAMEQARSAGDHADVDRFGHQLLSLDIDTTLRREVVHGLIPTVRLNRRADAAALIGEAMTVAHDRVERARLVFDLTALEKTVDPQACREVLHATLHELTSHETASSTAQSDDVADAVARLDANLILVDLIDPDGAAAPPPSVAGSRAAVRAAAAEGQSEIPPGERLRAAALAYRGALEGAGRAESVRLAELALGDGLDLGLEQQAIEAQTFAMITLAAADDPSLSRRTDQWASAAERSSSLPLLAASSAATARLALAHGRLDDAINAATDAIEKADAYGLDDSSTGRLYRSLLCESYYTAGRHSDARAIVDGMALTGAATDLHGPLPWLVMLRSGVDQVAAWDDAIAYGRRCERLGWNHVMFLPWRSTLAVIGSTSSIDPSYSGPDLRSKAKEYVDAEMAAADHWGSNRSVARAYRYAASVMEPTESLPYLERAIEAVEGTPYRYDHASCLMIRGLQLVGLPDTSVAGNALQQAIDAFDAIGGTRYSQLCRLAMAHIGVKVKAKQPTGLGALTKRERTVAEAAGRGLANQDIADEQFVSLRTVEYHLSNAYKKLQISGRAELIEVLSRST